MKIVIIGDGKVGYKLAKQLSVENYDVVLIDSNEKKLRFAIDRLDISCVAGNGADAEVQKQADVPHADLVIACTSADECNMLSCLIARRLGARHTIARVRNPVYSQEIGFIKEKLGISMIINPELAAAREISRLLRFPAAIKIDPFSRGRVELLKFKVLPEFGLDGMTVSKITEKYRCDILFCAIENKNELSIPGGDHIIHDGDFVSIIATPQNTALFFKKIGFKTHQVKSVLIIGGGTISIYLAKAMASTKIPVKIVEQDPQRCEFLSEQLPGATIINGDGTDRSLLFEEGLETAGAFVTLTNLDEENIFLSMFAKTVSKAKLVAKVNRLPYTDIIDDLDIGSVIYPKYLTADSILRYVRAMQNTIGSNVETLYHILDNQAEALEFAIHDYSSVVGVPLSELKLKKNLLVCCLSRNGIIRIPRGQDSIQIGDNVIIVTTHKGLHDICDILEK